MSAKRDGSAYASTTRSNGTSWRRSLKTDTSYRRQTRGALELERSSTLMWLRPAPLQNEFPGRCNIRRRLAAYAMKPELREAGAAANRDAPAKTRRAALVF